MKQFFIIVLLLLAVGTYTFSCRGTKQTPSQQIAAQLLLQIDTFSTACNNLQQAVEQGKATDVQVLALFKQARLRYKQLEWGTEFFDPFTSKMINGAPVPEYEPGEGQVLQPHGLQVIESLLYPRADEAKRTELIAELKLLQQDCNNLRSHFKNVEILDGQVFDAAKLQIFRVLTLGITGFDSPLAGNSLQECAVSLAAIKPALACYSKHEANEVNNRLDKAIAYLHAHRDFNTFNRAIFIADYGNPASVALSDMGKQLNIHLIRYNRLLNQDAKTLFDPMAFNLNAYMSDFGDSITTAKVALGRRLFADPVLSSDGSRSCQSCHQPQKAFTDGLAKNTVFHSTKLLHRNTPTLLNAAMQPSQFYDIRANMLEEQAFDVVSNKQEMHGSMKLAVKRLWRDQAYRRLFANAFPKSKRNEIDSADVVNALGSYVRSLTFLNSRFDEYMRGDRSAMNEVEINGFNLFMGKAKCGTCHYMPLFNGTFPPRFTRIETEVIGVPASLQNKAIDPDEGRFELVKITAFKHAFKTPTVRNAARTAPYMHNGIYQNLEQVVDFYNRGGGKGLGLNVDNQTLPFDKLNLTEKEKHELVAFIKSLDSKPQDN
jgi:cytochrome c peroxidase